MDNIRWKVTDPLGNEIFLIKKVYNDHICGDHADNDSEVRKSLEEHVKYSIEHPRFIVKATDFEGRRVYLDLADIAREDRIHVRPLFIVTEADGKIVTWFAKRSMNIKVPQDGGIIYDERTHRL